MPAAAARGGSRPGPVLGLVLSGQFMALLDVSVVNVAAPSVRSDLHASGAALQLVIAGYTIAYAVLLITGARLGARYGYSRMFRHGLAGFTAASLACGLAPGTGWLIGFRVAQGVAAAVMVPQVMSVIQRLFTGAARVRALGLYSAVLAGGLAIGQVVGGLLVSADLFGTGWRPVFLVNVPLGLVLLAASRRLLPALPGDAGRGFDLPGLLTLAAALGLLVVPLVLGHELGWPGWGWAMLAGSAALFAVFAAVERRVAARGGQPLITGRVLGAPGLLPAAGSIFLIMAGFAGFMFAFALHQQAGLGNSALRAGLLSVPVSVGFGAASLLWQRTPRRLHRLLPVLGLAVVAPGYVLVGLLLGGGGPVGPVVQTVLAVTGVAAGCAYSPLFARALGRVDPADAADASGVMVTVLQLGQVIGVTLLGTVFLGAVSYPASSAASGRALLVTTAVIGAALVVAAGLAGVTGRAGNAGNVGRAGSAAVEGRTVAEGRAAVEGRAVPCGRDVPGGPVE
ncbi:MFS transporter [Kitasatospora sp. NPDC007106]|uniref:MFS transporter n=1 Tax=Kitasatospora sp. NPDC007106 TaxID=3156914 RepID=UPI0033D33E5A